MDPISPFAEVLSSLEELPLPTQVSVLEAVFADSNLAAVAEPLAMCLMTTMLEVDDSTPADLRARLDVLVEKFARFNESRLKDSNLPGQ